LLCRTDLQGGCVLDWDAKDWLCRKCAGQGPKAKRRRAV